MPQRISGSVDPSGSTQDTRGGSLTWLWLLVGFALLPFTLVQTMLPLAAWLAPIFLLRFARTARRTWLALTLIFLAQAISKLIAIRGGESSNIYLTLIVVSTLAFFGGLISTLPYAADRLIGSRLDEKTRILVFPLAFTTIDWLRMLLARSGSSTDVDRLFAVRQPLPDADRVDYRHVGHRLPHRVGRLDRQCALGWRLQPTAGARLGDFICRCADRSHPVRQHPSEFRRALRRRLSWRQRSPSIAPCTTRRSARHSTGSRSTDRPTTNALPFARKFRQPPIRCWNAAKRRCAPARGL